MDYLKNYLVKNNIDEENFKNDLDKLNLDNNYVSSLLLDLDNKKYKKNKVNLYHFLYWLKTNQYIKNNVECFNSKDAFPQQILRIPLGRKNYIEFQRNRRVNFVAVYLNIQDKDKEIFEYLYQFKEDLDENFDFEILWDKREGEKISKIGQAFFIDVTDLDNWEETIKWQVDLAERLYIEFYPVLEDYYDSYK